MADYDSSLPVRSEADGTDERVHVKICDGATPAQMATVDTDLNLHIECHGNDPSASDVVLRLSENGHPNGDGVYNVSTNTDPANVGLIGHTRNASPADAQQTLRWTGVNSTADTTIWAMDVAIQDSNGDPISSTNPLYVDFPDDADLDVDVDGIYDGVNNTDPDNVGVVWHSRNATPGDAQQTFRPTGVQGTNDTTVYAIDVALFDENGDAFSSSNPLPVSIESGATSGTAVRDFKQASAVGKDASDTHTYTVSTGTTLTLSKVQGSASGKMKFELKTGSSGSESLVLVMFNSTANPNVEYEFAETYEVVAGDNVLIVMTNLDNQAQDLYSFIEGEEN